jgi:uncharacterized membrane protein
VQKSFLLPKSIPLGDSDTFGLIVALIGLGILLASRAARDIPLAQFLLAWLGFMLSTTGFIITLFPAPSDNPALNPLFWIEEVLSFISFSYSVVSLTSDQDNDGVPLWKDPT